MAALRRLVDEHMPKAWRRLARGLASYPAVRHQRGHEADREAVQLGLAGTPRSELAFFAVLRPAFA
jgi:hypothetical protein